MGDRLPRDEAAIRDAPSTVTVKVRDIDRDKRIAAETILPDGRNLNQELVRAGLAWWNQQYARRETVAAGSGAGGADGEAWAVERSEGDGALGVAEGGIRGSSVIE